MSAVLNVRDWNGVQIPAAGTFKLDPAHTRVGFMAKHMMVSKVRGTFNEFEGTITVAENPLESTVTATITTASVHTRQEMRDNHLRSGDFFQAEEFPTITFESTRFGGGQDGTFEIVGNLTIKGVTREVTLEAELEGVGLSPYGQEVIGFSASTEINREDFGLTYNQALETGGVMIGKSIKIDIEGEAIRS
jgi:polyisoprenoid-binding protein YceI